MYLFILIFSTTMNVCRRILINLASKPDFWKVLKIKLDAMTN